MAAKAVAEGRGPGSPAGKATRSPRDRGAKPAGKAVVKTARRAPEARESAPAPRGWLTKEGARKGLLLMQDTLEIVAVTANQVKVKAGPKAEPRFRGTRTYKWTREPMQGGYGYFGHGHWLARVGNGHPPPARSVRAPAPKLPTPPTPVRPKTKTNGRGGRQPKRCAPPSKWAEVDDTCSGEVEPDPDEWGICLHSRRQTRRARPGGQFIGNPRVSAAERRRALKVLERLRDEGGR